MYGVGGMKEKGRGAGGVERGHYLGGYVGALANARYHHTTRGRKYSLDSLGKSIIYTVAQILNSFFFVGNYLDSNLFYLFTTLHC